MQQKRLLFVRRQDLRQPLADAGERGFGRGGIHRARIELQQVGKYAETGIRPAQTQRADEIVLHAADGFVFPRSRPRAKHGEEVDDPVQRVFMHGAESGPASADELVARLDDGGPQRVQLRWRDLGFVA